MTSDDGFDEFYQSAFGRLVGQVYLVTGDLGDRLSRGRRALAKWLDPATAAEEVATNDG